MIRSSFSLLLLTTFAVARLNPFEPAEGFESFKGGANQPIPVSNIESEDDGKRTVKIESDPQEIQKDPKKITPIEVITKEPSEPKKVIQKENYPELPPQPKQATTQQIKEEVAPIIPTPIKKNIVVNTKKKPQQKKGVKKSSVKNKVIKKPIKKQPIAKSKKIQSATSSLALGELKQQSVHSELKRYNILPLLTIDLEDKNCFIQTRDNFRIIGYFEDKISKRIAFDFEGKIEFATAKEDFESPYYNLYIVGSHASDQFFRVAIELKEGVENYTITIENNKAKIIRK